MLKKLVKCLCFMCLVLTVTLCVSCKGKNEKIKVGIIKYTTATPLDAARSGIIEGLKEAGYVDGDNIEIVDFNCLQSADTMSQNVKSAIRSCDIIFAIATPVAQTLAKEMAKQGVKTPVLFTAVTDPVASGIIASDTKPGVTISGTSDMNPVAEQIALALELNSNAKKIGFIYTTTEDNSRVQLELARTKAAELGIEIVAQGVSSATELQTATKSLINDGVDAIYLPTDNNVSENAGVVINEANLNGIPTICGESTFLDKGGTITLGIDYKELGKLTGKMGADVLAGKVKIEELAVGRLTNFELIINVTAATSSNITISEELKSKANEIR
ncbi:MAG: ABC transporter substrate-binding protein [Bacilli bacterium]|nr:ABC transporter substrate-binding protein [Mollicutes bacterium]MDY3898991.1 ABC transporter substrate-binding protein [Bacilli bacterium]